MLNSIKVEYESTSNCYIADQWLNNLPDLFAADFEVASKWNNKDKELFKYRLENDSNLNRENKRLYKQILNSSGLSHPSLTVVTHLSVAWSDHEAKVFICDNDNIRKLIFNFLVTTDKTQIWHNIGFDGMHIMFHTGKYPKHVIDTQLLAKSVLNDADNLKNDTKLKHLMAYKYGAWAVAKDDFILEEQIDPNMIKYSATDACATYALYEDIMEGLAKWKI